MQSEDIRIQCNYSDNTVIVLELDCLNNVSKVMIQANKTGNLVSSDYDFLNSVFLFLAILRKKIVRLAYSIIARTARYKLAIVRMKVRNVK